MNKDTGELTLVDVEFLQAVRYIVENPDEFGSVEDDGVARTEAIGKLLREKWDTSRDWSKRMVRYRMLEGPDNRHWGVDEGIGMVRLHEADVTADGEYKSRGVELTDKGRRRLEEAEAQMNVERREGISGDLRGDEFDSDTTELEMQLRSLEEQVEEMNENLEMLASTVSEFEESETGAVDTQFAERFETVFRYVVRYQQFFEGVLELDTERLDPNDGGVDHAAVREQIAAALEEPADQQAGGAQSGEHGEQAGLDETIEPER